MKKPAKAHPRRKDHKPKVVAKKPSTRRHAPRLRTGAVPREAVAEQLRIAGEGTRLDYARSLIRNVPDFPKRGILFKDITPLLADPKGFNLIIDLLAEHFIGERVDAVVGIESRGFVFGGALAARLNTSFVPVRKPGKLPAAIDRVAYSLEYGTAELEMHKNALRDGARVVVVDDLLATGGTAAATGQLVTAQGACVAAYAFVIELTFLGGRDKLVPVPVLSLMSFGANE